MQTVKNRVYTNVALTAVIILLALQLLMPLVSAPDAQAQTGEFNESREVAAAHVSAAATREVAAANRDIAKAIDKSAKAQQDIARSIDKLSSILNSASGN